MNLRLYVEMEGRPGVWFISLDATNPLAVWAARRFFHLPYFHAAMELRAEGERIHYVSRRREGAARVEFRGTYWPTTAIYESKPGTLEHFLTERYCLYAQARDGSILRGEVHHMPWPLQGAGAEIEVNEVAGPQGIEIHGPPALLHFSRRIDVAVWSVERVGLNPKVEGVKEEGWLRAAASSPAFQGLEAPEEDVYSLEDGEPFDDPT
jgi:hypothetical protein